METTIKKQSIFHPSLKAQEVISDLIAYIFIFIFTYTAYDKIWGYENFRIFIMRLNYMHEIGRYVAWMIPGAEIVISIGLLIPRIRRVGLYSAFFLMVVFTVYLIHMKLTVSTNELPCHCGGFISQLSWVQHIWFNIGLIILAALGIHFFRPTRA